MADGVFLAFADEISQAKLCRVHAQFLGDYVRMRVDREGRRHGARTPVITAWNRVGVDLQKFQASVVDSILAAGVMPGGQRRIGFERAVGATGVDRAERARPDPAVRVNADQYRENTL